MKITSYRSVGAAVVVTFFLLLSGCKAGDCGCPMAIDQPEADQPAREFSTAIALDSALVSSW